MLKKQDNNLQNARKIFEELFIEHTLCIEENKNIQGKDLKSNHYKEKNVLVICYISLYKVICGNKKRDYFQN